MAIQTLMRHPVKVFNRVDGATAPGFSDEDRDFDDGTDAMGYIEPHNAKEFGTDRETRINDYDGYFLPSTLVKGTSQIEWNGVRYIVVGEPRLYSRPSGPHHQIVTMRSITD